MRGHDGLACWTVTTACVITLLLAGCDSAEPAGPGSPEPPKEPVQGLRLEARSDTTPTGVVGTAVTSVPVVRLTLGSDPAPGREVRFVASGGGSVEMASQRTDTAGLASPGTWTLGTTAESQTLTARVAGAADLVFTVAATAGAPLGAQIEEGNHQTAAAGALLPKPLRVRLRDQYGNPVSDWTVVFSVVVGAGTVAGPTVTSDSLGLVTSGVWRLGSAGPQAVNISIGGVDVTFDAFACDDSCRGRDLLYVLGNQLVSLVNGVATTLFTAPPGSAPRHPAWSPDGRRIAFTLEDYEPLGDVSHVAVYLMDADGSNPVRRADGFSDPSWSADGRQLALSGYDGVYTLSVEAAGAAPVLLIAGASDPAWSPDGTKIAYYVWQERSLKVMNADGSGIRTLVQSGDDNNGSFPPTWSPDGQRLAYTLCGPSGCRGYVVGAGGTDPTELEGVGVELAWSPDGKRIAFDGPGGVFWMPADGSFSQPILTAAEAGYSPAWRP